MAEGGLEKRTLGRTGLPVTVLGYGAMSLDRARMAPRGLDFTDEQAGQVLNAALDAGINFIDTAPDYGVSEELIGRYISGRRDEYFIATKAGCPVAVPRGEAQGERHVYTRDNIRAAVEQSLRRMATDYLDLVQFHGNPSPETLAEHDAIGALRELQAEGKIRYIGVSGARPRLASQIELGVFDAFQIPYSILQREHESLVADAAKAGGGTIIRGGAVRGGPSDDKGWDVRLTDPPKVEPRDAWEGAHLEDLLDGATRMEFVLRFAIANPDVHTNIVGTGKVAHLQSNVAAALKGPLPPDVFAEARRRLDAVQQL